MLSTIQNVKLPHQSAPSAAGSSPNTNSVQEAQDQQEQSHSSVRSSASTDMSRRKQRNPKPIFNPTEDIENKFEDKLTPNQM